MERPGRIRYLRLIMKDNKMEFQDTGDSKFTIVFDKIVENKSFLPSTRLLAIDIIKNGYINVGDFFKCMSDSDLKTYLNMAENIESDEGTEILLLSEMLAIGEGLDNGLDENEIETMQNRMSQLIMYLTCESLARQGLVKLYRENMSFGEDMAKKTLVEKLF